MAGHLRHSNRDRRSDVGTYTLIPGGPGVSTSPFGSFIYDNVITLSANPALDVDGLCLELLEKK